MDIQLLCTSFRKTNKRDQWNSLFMSLTLAMLHQSFNSSTWNPVFIDGFCHRHWEKLPCATHMDAALQGHYLLYLHHPTIRWSSQLYKNLPDISIKANAASLVFLTDCSLVIQSLQSPPTPPRGTHSKSWALPLSTWRWLSSGSLHITACKEMRKKKLTKSRATKSVQQSQGSS